jgi:hypothetical protein
VQIRPTRVKIITQWDHRTESDLSSKETTARAARRKPTRGEPIRGGTLPSVVSTLRQARSYILNKKKKKKYYRTMAGGGVDWLSARRFDLLRVKSLIYGRSPCVASLVPRPMRRVTSGNRHPPVDSARWSRLGALGTARLSSRSGITSRND